MGQTTGVNEIENFIVIYKSIPKSGKREVS